LGRSLERGQSRLEFVGSAEGRVTTNLASLTLGRVQMEFATSPEAGLVNEQVFKSRFKQGDLDGNGYLENMEATRIGLNPAMFTLLDVDKNGKVFEEEYVGVFVPLTQLEQGRVQLDIADRGRDLFRILDTSGDGRLGPREFLAAVDRMSHWDTNNDERVAQNELPQQFAFSIGRGSLNPTGRATVAFSPARAGVPVRPQQADGPAWFTKMDRNGDGDVSQREFLGPADVFTRLDKDANGLLDASEAAEKE
jgi:hypothetical protein